LIFLKEHPESSNNSQRLQMTIAQIEQNLQNLMKNFNSETFIYDLLLVYGLPKASITRLQKGNLNLSKAGGEISWEKKVFFKPVLDADLYGAITQLNGELKHNHRFVVVTDYKTLLAIDTKTNDKLDIDFNELPRHYDFFLPWAGMEKKQQKKSRSSGSSDKSSGPESIIIYNTPDGKASVSLYAKDGSVWMNQNQLAELFDTSKQNIGQHISNILKERELDQNSVVKNYFTTAADGKGYNVTFYSLDMILSIGFRVRSKRGTQFRIWANRNLKEYMIKGFVIDDERLKNPDGRPDYFDELLRRIRDIRASEKRFYQKVRDLFALSSDYDPSDKATQMFFAETQNKLLYAVTGKTAAELIVSRARGDAPNMSLTSWKGSIVRKGDIFTAKNYLSEDEIDTLNRLVVIFL